MSKIHASTYKSNTNEWFTPLGFVEKVLEAADLEQFDIDVCSSMAHIPASIYYEPDRSGLERPWTGYCWMNPPYGLQLKSWVEKAVKESLENDCTVFALLPARTETKYFHEFVLDEAACVCFLKSPFCFLKNENGILKPSGKAGFPLLLAVYSKNKRFVTDFVDLFQENDDVTIMGRFEI